MTISVENRNLSEAWDQRTVAFDQAVANAARQGWAVESRTDSQAILVKGHRPNHILHLILSIVTAGLWIPVWIIVSLASGQKRWVISK